MSGQRGESGMGAAGSDVVRREDPREFEAIHGWFELTYANYLVLPRSVLQSMPEEWQSSFVALLRECDGLYGGLDWPDYAVQCRDGRGRFTKDTIPHYNRGRTRIPPCPFSWTAHLDRLNADDADDIGRSLGAGEGAPS